MTSRSDDPAQPFTLMDVGILILEAVEDLHRRGHQRLRILPGMSGSGMHWRTAITRDTNFTDGRRSHLVDFSAAFHYTTGMEFEVAEGRVDASTTAAELADRILARLPDSGIGTDSAYVSWYREMLDLVRATRALPIAYADYFDGENGWEIGWGSGLWVKHPPASTVAHAPTSDKADGPTFIGTLAQFNRYLGPQWRVVVQRLTKKHKASVGACEFDPAHDGPFDAAHIHGRERTTLIRRILGNPAADDVLTVDIADFEAAFKAEHTPLEKSILVLCKSCHTRYDSSPAVMHAPSKTGASVAQSEDQQSEDQQSEDQENGEIAPGTLVLPITLEPRDPEIFKASFLKTGTAWIDVYFGDGHVERQLWRANKLGGASNVVGNLRSRPNFRQGKWQALGIAKVHVAVVHLDSAVTTNGPDQSGAHAW